LAYRGSSRGGRTKPPVIAGIDSRQRRHRRGETPIKPEKHSPKNESYSLQYRELEFLGTATVSYHSKERALLRRHNPRAMLKRHKGPENPKRPGREPLVIESIQWKSRGGPFSVIPSTGSGIVEDAKERIPVPPARFYSNNWEEAVVWALGTCSLN